MLDGQLLVPGSPGKSALYASILNGTMPPGGKLSSGEMDSIRDWIQAGAPWEGEATLAAPAKSAAPGGSGGEMANVNAIRERIVKTQAKTGAYSVTVPNTTVKYDMVPIPAGDFTMDPKYKVHVSAFAMQAHEVTWDEYRLFMFANQAGEVEHKDSTVDAVSRPTRPYVEMSFGMGINGFPAISMTQHAANKYAEWLSSKTGQFYRLPTEAEWQYACQAGSTAQPTPLADFAIFQVDSGGKYAKVASKKPNAWQLYDMLGNVMEWTLDAYEPYKTGTVSDPWVKATQPYPHAVRGGSWNDPASQVTCSARVASDASWKQQDPQLPKSIWYMTDAQWLGFRLVQPAKLPSAEELFKYWNSGVEHDEQ